MKFRLWWRLFSSSARIVFFSFTDFRNTRTPDQPNKQTNMHKERLIAIDTIILSSESTLNHSKLAQHSIGKKTDSLLGTLWFKHFTFKQLPLLNLSRASEGRCENLLWCRRQIWAPHAFWPAGAQRKTLVREGRNLCAINCLSLKSHLISTAECLSTRYRDNKGMKRPGWYGWNSEFKSFKE